MREANLLNYTDFETIGKATEFYERVKAENPEFKLLYFEFLRVLRDTHILEADERGIKRYEDMLGILSYGSLEERRTRAFLEWNRQTVWTDRTLREFLNGLIGRDSYKLSFMYGEYALNFRLFYSKRAISFNELLKFLKEIIPANIWLYFNIEFAEDYIFAGARRRVLKIKYHEYEPTDIKGDLKPIFAGYFVSMIRREYPIQKQGNLIAKGYPGYLTSDIGRIKGVFK